MLHSICIGGQNLVPRVMSHPLKRQVQSIQFIYRPSECSSAYFAHGSLLLFMGVTIFEKSEHCRLDIANVRFATSCFRTSMMTDDDLLAQKDRTITQSLTSNFACFVFQCSVYISLGEHASVSCIVCLLVMLS